MVITNLGATLAILYPNAQPPFDYTVYDDGTGPKLIQWDVAKLGAQPTDEALAAASLTAVKQSKRTAIDARSQAIIGEGFTFDGQRFGLSPEDQQHLTGLFAFQAGLTFPIDLTTLDDTAYVVADAAALQNLCGAALGTVKAAIDSGRTLKIAVNDAADAAAVDAVVDNR